MSIELENLYNEILNLKCRKCHLRGLCSKLEGKGIDNICDNTLEVIEKKIVKEENK